MAEAKRLAEDLHQEALNSLSVLGEKAGPLRDIAGYIINRQN